jgi:hypothetical protein
MSLVGAVLHLVRLMVVLTRFSAAPAQENVTAQTRKEKNLLEPDKRENQPAKVRFKKCNNIEYKCYKRGLRILFKNF